MPLPPHALRPLVARTTAALALFGLLAGCGQNPPGADASAPAVVRGEPIHGSPIRPVTNPAPVALPAPVAQATPVTNAPGRATPITPGYQALGFDRLSAYNFVMPDDTVVTNQTAALEQANSQIPSPVKALDAQRVSVKGFMLPLKVDGGEVTEFLLMKDQSMCCYGAAPRINEWISVKTTGKGVKAIMDQPISIEGTLHVGATRENGYLVGLYNLDGERLIAPPDR